MAGGKLGGSSGQAEGNSSFLITIPLESAMLNVPPLHRLLWTQPTLLKCKRILVCGYEYRYVGMQALPTCSYGKNTLTSLGFLLVPSLLQKKKKPDHSSFAHLIIWFFQEEQKHLLPPLYAGYTCLLLIPPLCHARSSYPKQNPFLLPSTHQPLCPDPAAHAGLNVSFRISFCGLSHDAEAMKQVSKHTQTHGEKTCVFVTWVFQFLTHFWVRGPEAWIMPESLTRVTWVHTSQQKKSSFLWLGLKSCDLSYHPLYALCISS